MSVVWTRFSVETQAIVPRQAFGCGTLIGCISDMNVQGTQESKITEIDCWRGYDAFQSSSSFDDS